MSNSEESITALALRYRRNTRDLNLIRLCDDVLERRVVPNGPVTAVQITAAPRRNPEKWRAYMREYMRAWRKRKTA